MIAYDPGVGGGLAMENLSGEIVVIPMPEHKIDKKKGIKKLTSKQFSMYQYENLKKMIHTASAITKETTVWMEAIGPRPADTPRTSFSLSANYHIALTLFRECGLDVKLVSPQHWQNQLGRLVPSGSHNYEKRKKLFQSFATEKFSETAGLYIQKDGEIKVRNSVKVTKKTADALCILWVYSGRN